jgi:lipoyl-dependent peroxiredoxin
MPAAQSRAKVVWVGDLATGGGVLDLESGVMSNQPVSWPSRTHRATGKTSPEEMIAGAHAACYAMALSNTLAQAGMPPKRLEISAACTFEQVEGKFRITIMELEVAGDVPGLNQSEFEDMARRGEDGCPVSNALRNNVEIRVKARLLNQ